MNQACNPALIFGAVLSAVAALLHVGCIVFGAPWYRFFGAGEKMAQLAAAGSWRPTIITSCIVGVLMVWALYALSGAGVIAKLPLLRLALCIITGIYLLRGLAVFPLVVFTSGRSTSFGWWSSAICLALGMVHAIGLKQVWATL